MSSLVNVHWDSKLPIYEISHLKLQNEGIKSLLIDVDGTLLSRQSNIVPINVKNWIKESKKLFSLYLISNNPSCLLYTSPSPRDLSTSRMPSSA